MADLSVNIKDLKLKNPVMTASVHSVMDWSLLISCLWRRLAASS